MHELAAIAVEADLQGCEAIFDLLLPRCWWLWETNLEAAQGRRAIEKEAPPLEHLALCAEAALVIDSRWTEVHTAGKQLWFW